MSEDFILNQKEYLEKKLNYEGKDWKLKIIISINSLRLLCITGDNVCLIGLPITPSISLLLITQSLRPS